MPMGARLAGGKGEFMSEEEEMTVLIEERKAAYLEHWQNTERLIAVEKEWRLAKEQGDVKRLEVLQPIVEHWRDKVNQSKQRAFIANLRWQEKGKPTK